jgi:UDP-N-acetylglucosamine 4,6-dehydratase
MKNKIILITGGTGSWGTELTTQLLKEDPKEIRIFSRGEFAQVSMQRAFNDKRLKFIIGDVRDYDAILDATQDVNIVYHLAALKHVPICEEQPTEAIKTNILGTQNLVKSAYKNKIEKIVDVSTDKACAPVNFYGMTKAIGERLFINASIHNLDTQFTIIRGGNALGSNGSVVPFFIKQIKDNNRITITHKEMTRFFITLSEAIQLVLCASDSELSGGLFVMKMPACSIMDLAKVLIEHYGDKTTKLEEIGMRQGEKIHEVLVSEFETPWTYYWNDKYFLFAPNIKTNLDKVEFKEYSSNYDLMTKAEIESLLQRGGYINE